MSYENRCRMEVKFSTYEEVRNLKGRGDTFDTVIKRLLEVYNEVQKDDLYVGLVVDSKEV